MSDDDKKDNHELTDEEVINHLEAWEKWKEKFPKLPFPRNYSNEAKFGTDWLDHLLDLERKEHIFENSINVHVLMEQFCWFVKEQQEIPIHLSSFIARAFHDYLRHRKSLEQGFLLKGETGKKIKRNYNGNPFPIELGHYLWAVIVDGIDPVEAKKVIQEENNIAKSTLNTYMDNERLKLMALENVIGSVEVLEYRHLTEEEQKRLKDMFPKFPYIPMLSKDYLEKLKAKDESDAKKRQEEEKVEALKKQFGYDKF